MKKIAILTALLVFTATLASASNAITMDLTDKTTTGKTVNGLSSTSGTPALTDPIIGKTSTGVGVAMLTGAKGYALSTQHMSGTKGFGSSYDSTSIFAKLTTVGTPALATVTATDTTDFTTANGWEKL